MVTPIGVFYDDEPPRCLFRLCSAVYLTKLVGTSKDGKTEILYLCHEHLRRVAKRMAEKGKPIENYPFS